MVFIEIIFFPQKDLTQRWFSIYGMYKNRDWRFVSTTLVKNVFDDGWFFSSFIFHFSYGKHGKLFTADWKIGELLNFNLQPIWKVWTLGQNGIGLKLGFRFWLNTIFLFSLVQHLFSFSLFLNFRFAGFDAGYFFFLSLIYYLFQIHFFFIYYNL